MGKALYREYRPRTLADVAGQPHITGALERSLKTGVISHAFLFTGPRGVGKTSVARILAYQVNNLPYDDTASHLDIIEIDAASNRGIEDVRELRDKVAVAPTSAKYKVYIIDEVHMLTTPAFNALLKTLEEPPSHVIFILATTEAHKVPETIVSRTQHYAFRPIESSAIVGHLKQIAEKEGIQVETDALELIATHSGGSFRDSIGLLDQVRHSNEKVSIVDVRSIFGIAPEQALKDIVRFIASHDVAAVYTTLAMILEQGITPSSLASQLATMLRSDLRQVSHTLSLQQSLDLLAKLIEVAPSSNPEISLEVILLGAAMNGVDDSKTTSTPNTAPKIENIVLPKTLDVKQEHKPEESAKPQAEAINTPLIERVSEPPRVIDQDFVTAWQEVLLRIKKSQYTLYGVLRMCDASSRDSEVTLRFRFKLHQKKVSDSKNKDIIANVLKDVTGKDYSVLCVEEGSELSATNSPQPLEKTQPSLKGEDLSTISNIFGGGELLES
jgi:DNA polymerase III subunit gamma/tau